MNIKFSSIADSGVPADERLILKVLLDTDIGQFVVFRAKARNGSVTTGVETVFWFPDKAVKAGDLVVLYTKKGVTSEKILKNGNRAHFFHWGISSAIWDDKTMAAVILHVSEWKSYLRSEA